MDTYYVSTPTKEKAGKCSYEVMNWEPDSLANENKEDHRTHCRHL